MPTVANLTDSLQMKADDMTRLLLAVLAAAGLNFGVAGAASGADEPTATAGRPGDWPQWGGSPARNNAPRGKNIPAQWNVGQFERKTGKWLRTEAKNIKWVAKLGTEGYGSAVVAGGKIFAATNNGAAYLKRYPAKVDLGCLLCFNQSDGRFLWQHSAEKLKAGRTIDWPQQGICCCPMVRGDRLWLVTNRGEVVCLDTQGFADGQNDGPFTAEAATGAGESDVVWRYDMMRELGSVQHNMCSCSVTAVGDLLLVNTSNGVDGTHETIPAPEAPSFIALEAHTGKLVWADGSPGRNILHGQWSSPAAAVLGDVPQAIFAGGDGWVYSFLARPTDSGKPELLWKFDCNPKRAHWGGGGVGDRNNIIATPVIHNGRVYVATGQDPESGEGQGDLWCIDPTGRGDTSAEVVVDKDGKPVPPSRIQAVDEDAGQQVRPNPNSAAVWHYRGHDANGDGTLDFEETMHRALGMVAIKDGLLVIGDFAGLVHCLDADTAKVHWTYDVLATIWGAPLLVDGKVYIGDEDGDVAVFELSPQLKLLAENNMGDSVYSTPVVADNILYITSRSRLFAICPDQ